MPTTASDKLSKVRCTKLINVLGRWGPLRVNSAGFADAEPFPVSLYQQTISEAN